MRWWRRRSKRSKKNGRIEVIFLTSQVKKQTPQHCKEMSDLQV
jgi:hypothetical protein